MGGLSLPGFTLLQVSQSRRSGSTGKMQACMVLGLALCLLLGPLAGEGPLWREAATRTPDSPPVLSPPAHIPRLLGNLRALQLVWGGPNWHLGGPPG